MKYVLAPLFVFTAATALWAQTIISTVPVSHDGDASASYYSGNKAQLSVAGTASVSRAWLRFNTAGVDFSAIKSAQLNLAVKTVGSPGTLQVFALTTPLSSPENNTPAHLVSTGSTPLGTLAIGTAQQEKIVSIDVTVALKSGGFNGLVLASNDGLVAAFDAKEGAFKPFISLNHGIDPAVAWLLGTNIPAAASGKEGDMYLNTDTGDLYSKSATGWQFSGNIRGAHGLDGAPGDKGDKGDKGDSGSMGPQGPQGDSGLAGPQGISGVKGDKGDSGAVGPSGAVIWNSITAGQEAAPGNGYIITSAVTQTMTLPSTPSVGDRYQFVAANRSGFKIIPGNAAHVIEFSPRSTSNAVSQVNLTAPTTSIAPAANEDGSILYYAQVNGSIYHSYDNGVSWKPATTNLSAYFFGQVASSADGRTVIASAYNSNNGVVVSTDYGKNWTQVRGTNGNGYYGCSISRNGSTMYTAVRGDFIYRSTDFGTTWSSGGSVSGDWYSVATSADGNTAVACQGSGDIYVTIDGGTTWTLKSTRNAGQAVAISADGTRMYAVGTSVNSPIYASENSGATWEYRGAAKTFVSVATSADGFRLVAGTGGGSYSTWISHDAGFNWASVASNTNSTLVAISGDGTTPISNCYNGSVSTFKNAHNHWYSGMCSIGGFSQGANAEIMYLGNNRFCVVGGRGIDLY